MTTFPSAQISVQAEAVDESPKVHVQSVSTEHDDEQPSPSFEFPSSQYPAVGLITAPSPQISVHTLEVLLSPRVQLQLVSTVQTDDQPSLLLLFPSSQ